MIGNSERMKALLRLLERIAKTPATIMLQGESGTGKALLAEAIHRASPWADGPFVTVDGTSIPASLMESEVFGHEAGAFTDARQRKQGHAVISLLSQLHEKVNLSHSLDIQPSVPSSTTACLSQPREVTAGITAENPKRESRRNE
ncbi:MAG: sigma 54-interacting transcriptional regulator [Candidatus Latescibacteria bacterium]|nr:sigma 54-interacting transcriptional regulator [Candidatus Latescibacterota bacterium]